MREARHTPPVRVVGAEERHESEVAVGAVGGAHQRKAVPGGPGDEVEGRAGLQPAQRVGRVGLDLGGGEAGLVDDGLVGSPCPLLRNIINRPNAVPKQKPAPVSETTSRPGSVLPKVRYHPCPSVPGGSKLVNVLNVADLGSTSY